MSTKSKDASSFETILLKLLLKLLIEAFCLMLQSKWFVIFTSFSIKHYTRWKSSTSPCWKTCIRYFGSVNRVDFVYPNVVFLSNSISPAFICGITLMWEIFSCAYILKCIVYWGFLTRFLAWKLFYFDSNDIKNTRVCQIDISFSQYFLKYCLVTVYLRGKS